ncbi:MAG: hypothetical protein A4E40_00021 [Methanoregulaceae archaeon PtaU1.Bin059]|nr:MAG: hypothetical protein A4E39_00328 [Methanoregulaceae archaeon PtaB.Bin152]OPY43804.1 MAG: hypothetical protein A4E40_00021 [Methanoregulaceae archaeon PtaU1.Bin059]
MNVLTLFFLAKSNNNCVELTFILKMSLALLGKSLKFSDWARWIIESIWFGKSSKFFPEEKS